MTDNEFFEATKNINTRKLVICPREDQLPPMFVLPPGTKKAECTGCKRLVIYTATTAKAILLGWSVICAECEAKMNGAKIEVLTNAFVDAMTKPRGADN